ncbi:MAG: glycoside hydrolase N-terminal domain-containing protein [Bacteroidota bacterium]
MKKRLLSFFFSIITVCTFSQKEQDLKLWYNKPASKWTDALPIGNGRLGAMVFGGVLSDRIQFNEETLWTGSPRNYNREGAYKYLPKIRQLLFDGKQKEAQDLAEAEFMGLKSNEGEKAEWVKNVLALQGCNGNPAEVAYNDDSWQTIKVPSFEGWEVTGHEGLDGAVWFRTSFDLPADWQNKDLILDLNRIRDHDLTYVNGKLVGSMVSNEPRNYTVLKETLLPGKNTIAIQVLNYFDKGGLAGYKDTSKHIGLYVKGDPAEKKISLNKNWKYFIQNDSPPAVPHYQADYQPFGDLYLYFDHGGTATGYKRELDLDNAIIRTFYTTNDIQYTREYFASEPNQVVVIHLKASTPGSINFSAVVNSPHKGFIVKKIDEETLGLAVKVRSGALKGNSYLQVRTINGSSIITGDSIVVKNSDEVTLYLAAGTNYRNYKDISADPVAVCTKALESVKNKTYQQVKGAHTREYKSWFNTLAINLGSTPQVSLPTNERIENFASGSDPSFVALYLQYGRYLLISSSRPGTRPANLQGIWNDLLSPPWGSKYTTNINAEMNYWPAELLNLPAMHAPLFDMIAELSEAGKQTARQYYDAPGFVVHHNTDLWRGTAAINAANHGIWVTGGAWLATHLWEHYLFTQDKVFLRQKAYPIMKEAAGFFNNFLIKDPVTGFYISTPSNSPEQNGLVAGPTMDHQIIRTLFNQVISAAALLKIDNGFADILQQKMKLVAPNKIGRFGQLQEWMQDIDDTTNKHRHVSHLWSVYPGNEINWDETPELVKAARQSLLYRGDAATGWSLGWKINLWARFKDGDHAFKLIQMLLSPAEKNGAGSYVNLFDAHPPFQIDGNFGGAAGIGELLIQSHTKYIDILPALPAALPNGEVKGICARGGFVMDIKWRTGKLQQLSFTSLAGKKAVIRCEGKVVTIETVKGKSYRLNQKLELL